MNDVIIQNLKQFISATFSQNKNDLRDDINDIRDDIKRLDDKIDHVEEKLTKKMSNMDSKIDDVDARSDVILEAVGEQNQDTHKNRIVKLKAKTA